MKNKHITKEIKRTYRVKNDVRSILGVKKSLEKWIKLKADEKLVKSVIGQLKV